MNPVNFALHKLMPIIRTIVRSPKDGVAAFVGSAFLFKNDNKYFLVTAAHVLDHQNDKYRPRKQHAKSVIFFGHLLLALRRPQRLAIFRLECVLRDLSICDKAALVHICALVVAAAQVVP